MLMEQENLIRRVFNTPDGKQLLRLLADEYLYQPITSNENNAVFRRLGKQDLVLLFTNTLYRKGEIHDRSSSE
jgi:hypothetical protein